MEPDEYHPEEQTNFEDKWSPEIMARGAFTMVPNLLLMYSRELGIRSSELVILIHLESFRWSTRPAYPSIQRLSIRTGMSERHISRIISGLVYKGYVIRDRRKNRTNVYNITPLIKCLHETALTLPEDFEEIIKDEGDNYFRVPDIVDVITGRLSPDFFDTTTGHTSPIEPDIIVPNETTSMSPKEDTDKTNKLSKKIKSTPQKNNFADNDFNSFHSLSEKSEGN